MLVEGGVEGYIFSKDGVRDKYKHVTGTDLVCMVIGHSDTHMHNAHWDKIWVEKLPNHSIKNYI